MNSSAARPASSQCPSIQRVQNPVAAAEAECVSVAETARHPICLTEELVLAAHVALRPVSTARLMRMVAASGEFAAIAISRPRSK